MSAEQEQEQHDKSLETLLTFPTTFPIKVMGKNTPEFRQLVNNVASQLITPDKLQRIDEQVSSNQTYLACTIVAVFDQQSSIDAIYQAFSKNPLVLMAL